VRCGVAQHREGTGREKSKNGATSPPAAKRWSLKKKKNYVVRSSQHFRLSSRAQYGVTCTTPYASVHVKTIATTSTNLTTCACTGSRRNRWTPVRVRVFVVRSINSRRLYHHRFLYRPYMQRTLPQPAAARSFLNQNFSSRFRFLSFNAVAEKIPSANRAAAH
jgi:hypothetical protein